MGNILVIDDEVGILSLINEVLTDAGFMVETATDGEKGLEKYDKGTFDLIITDMHMPGKNGHFVIKHIRRSKNHMVPIIGISGTPWLLNDNELDAMLSKPFSLQTLVNAVKDLVQTPCSTSALS